MWIELRNITCSVVRATNEEHSWLREYLSFADATAQYRTRYAKGNGRIEMYNGVAATFPSGLIPLVVQAAPKEGFQIQLIDKRVNPIVTDASADLVWLRDYQREAIQEVIANTRGILQLPTGAGKTEVFAGLTRALPGRWLFLVHRTSLVDQAAERVERRTGLTVGRIGEGAWTDFSEQQRVVCASFQTITSRIATPECAALLQASEGICVDECHTLPSTTFMRVAMLTPRAYYRVGLSGTPLARGDKKSILAIGALGKVIYKLHPSVLIAAGVLSKPRIKMLPVAQRVNHASWREVYGSLVVHSDVRNAAVVRAVQLSAKPCLVFVKEINHGRILQQAIAAQNLKTEFVWGSDSTPARQAAIKRLVRGDIDVLVCSVVFQEGIDIPELASVVIASGGKSVIAALQRIGRGMRVSAGKTEFEVFDIMDKGNGMLEKHARERLKAYAGQGYETSLETTRGWAKV